MTYVCVWFEAIRRATQLQRDVRTVEIIIMCISIQIVATSKQLVGLRLAYREGKQATSWFTPCLPQG